VTAKKKVVTAKKKVVTAKKKSQPKQLKQSDMRRSERTHDKTAGIRGRRGPEGKSAYDLAVAHGFVGSEIEWLESFRGRDGKDGVSTTGESAYQLAVKKGFVGNVTRWLNSLHGRDGKDSTAAGKDGKDGESINGLSAYEVARRGGYPGAEADWLLSLIGPPGKPAKIDTSNLVKKDSNEIVLGDLFVINKKTESPLGESCFTVGSRPKWFGLIDFSTPRRYFKAVKLLANAIERRLQFEGAAIIEIDGEVLLESEKMESPTGLLTREVIQKMIDDSKAKQ